MKKFFASLIIFLSFLSVAGQAAAQTSEHIISYDTLIAIQQDSSINVTEKIRYDFGTNQRHGIFRNIPISYKARGGTFNLRISGISIQNDGAKTPFTTSNSDGETILKIGDPDIFITGPHTYTINYHIQRAMNYFEDHDELYWNATGNGWKIPIQSATFTVTSPPNTDQSKITSSCFTGIAGSTEKNCTVETQSGNSASDGLIIKSVNPLPPTEGLTAVIGLPKGSVTPISGWQNIWFILEDNWILALPLVVFFIMLKLWQKYGRDPEGKTTIVPQYEPMKDLPPILTNVILTEAVKQKDTSAEIIYLATKGLLTIKRFESTTLGVFKNVDYELTKTNSNTATLTPIEISLYNAIFKNKDTVTLSTLKTDDTFHTAYSSVLSGITKQATEQGFFPKNPNYVKFPYIVAGFIVIFLSFILLIPLYELYGLLAGILSSIIIIVFGIFMPARTQKGVEAKTYLLGLKQYLSYAEKDRLDFHNAPEKNPERFEKLLPFAIALGVETAWAKQFEGIYNTPPTWYTGTSGTAFNAALFAANIGDFGTSMNSAFATSTASSGSSGFSGGGSGGGFGGGGGGSW